MITRPDHLAQSKTKVHQANCQIKSRNCLYYEDICTVLLDFFAHTTHCPYRGVALMMYMSEDNTIASIGYCMAVHEGKVHAE